MQIKKYDDSKNNFKIWERVGVTFPRIIGKKVIHQKVLKG